MSDRETIEKLIKEGQVEELLTRGSAAKEEIQALQRLLYKLGFGTELNWEIYGADGGYGGSTTNAVKTFANRNGLAGDGETVTGEIAKKLIARFDILDDMRYLNSALKKGDIGQRLYYGSPDSVGIVALQTLLNKLGLGEQLKWEKYGADGYFGTSTAAAVSLFAQKEGIDCPEGKVNNPLATRIINKMAGVFGADWANESPAADYESGNLSIQEKDERGKTRFYISDGVDEVRFTKFRKGVYYVGKQKAIDAINANKASLQGVGLTDSAINVMIAVSENEGNLDAINTWDNSFMTFGMFQWTIGVGTDPGELAALLAKIKTADPAVFDKYYSQYGLDIKLVNNISGFMILEGQKLISPADKERLRTLEWAYYFWKSGQDSQVQVIQIQHALSRLNVFYRSDSYKPNGFYINQLVTSEYGVGLLLDNHVNRPGYVRPCLEQAMNDSGLLDPANWGTQEEMQLIEAYLKVRVTYGRSPMTHADKRAAVTKKYLDNGTISAERGSFEFELL